MANSKRKIAALIAITLMISGCLPEKDKYANYHETSIGLMWWSDYKCVNNLLFIWDAFNNVGPNVLGADGLPVTCKGLVKVEIE